MSRKHVFTLIIVIVLLVLLSTVAFANGWEAPAYQDGMTMPTATPVPADNLPVNPQTGATGTYDGTTAGTMATGSCPMMNGTTGMSGMNGMSGMSGMNGMNGMNGMSGMSGMTGMNGNSGMNGMTTMNGMAYYPTSLWDLNPWMLIGWVALGLILLVILLGIVYGFIRLIHSLPARPEKTA